MKALAGKIANFSTPHTRDTENPQTYWRHFRGAFFPSLWLFVFGMAGVIHAIFPEIKSLQFYTSSNIIRAYRALEKSRRHDDEIEAIFSAKRASHVRKYRGK